MTPDEHKMEAERILEYVKDAIEASSGIESTIEYLAAWNANVQRDLSRAQVHATLALRREDMPDLSGEE